MRDYLTQAKSGVYAKQGDIIWKEFQVLATLLHRASTAPDTPSNVDGIEIQADLLCLRNWTSPRHQDYRMWV